MVEMTRSWGRDRGREGPAVELDPKGRDGEPGQRCRKVRTRANTNLLGERKKEEGLGKGRKSDQRKEEELPQAEGGNERSG